MSVAPRDREDGEIGFAALYGVDALDFDFEVAVGELSEASFELTVLQLVWRDQQDAEGSAVWEV